MPERLGVRDIVHRPSCRAATAAAIAAMALVTASIALPAQVAPQAPAEADSAELQATRAQLGTLLGTRVRIDSDAPGNRTFRGLLDSVKTETVVVDTITDRPRAFIFGGPPPLLDRYRRVTVEIEDIRELGVSRGTSRTRGVAWGAAIGAVLVGTLEALGGTSTRNPSGSEFAGNALRGAAIGAALGAPIGYLFGRERWSRVELGGTGGI